jgi:CheY-like chemotaxis protein
MKARPDWIVFSRIYNSSISLDSTQCSSGSILLRMAMANILLADADRELRETCAAFLSGRGFRADTAETGLQCVAKLRRDVPDVLILDWELPWGGGDGVLGFLREEPQFLPERIVLTSSAKSARVLRGLTAPPAVHALTKPFSPAELLKHTAIDADEPEFSSTGDQRSGILVVDDEDAIRDLLRIHLQDHGYRVWTAPGGDEALDLCCNHDDEIAVVLLDVNMPGADGPQTRRHSRFRQRIACLLHD